MKKFYQRRRLISFAALAMLAVVAAILAVPTFGLSLLALAAPHAAIGASVLAHKAGLIGSKYVLGMAAAVASTPAPFKFVEPINTINGIPSTNAGGIAIITVPAMKRLNVIHLEPSITLAAQSSVRSIPTLALACNQIQFKVAGRPQRTRLATDLWGATALNALCDINTGGTVVYTQTGNSTLSTIPVLIGSAADIAQQALLTVNTATTATYFLPILFAEQFRKDYSITEALCLPTGFSDGTNIGQCTVEVTLPNTSANTPATSGIGLKASYEYDDLVAAAGTAVSLVKNYRYTVVYAAAGPVECGLQLPLNGNLQRISLLTVSDQISGVVVKLGSRILRQYSQQEMAQILQARDYNPAALIPNRFDIEFDMNDDPNSSPLMNANTPLSVLATLATANDSGKTIAVLASYYGPID